MWVGLTAWYCIASGHAPNYARNANWPEPTPNTKGRRCGRGEGRFPPSSSTCSGGSLRVLTCYARCVPYGVWNLSRTHYQAVLPPSNHYFPYFLGWANWLCVMPLHCFSLHQARRSTSVLLPLRKQGQYRGHATSHRQCEPLISALVSSTGQRSERSQTRNPRTLMTRTPFPCTRWCAKRTWAPKVERWNTSRFIQSS